MHITFKNKTLGYGAGKALPNIMKNVFRQDLILTKIDSLDWVGNKCKKSVYRENLYSTKQDWTNTCT